MATQTARHCRCINDDEDEDDDDDIYVTDRHRPYMHVTYLSSRSYEGLSTDGMNDVRRFDFKHCDLFVLGEKVMTNPNF